MATIFKIKKIHPVFNQIVTTRDLYHEQTTKGGVILGRAQTIKEYQTVIAVGPLVKGIKPGDTVFIDPRRYMQLNHTEGKRDLEKNVIQDNMRAKFNIPTFELYDLPDGGCRPVLLIGDNDVSFVAEGEEFETTPAVAPGNEGLVTLN